MTTARDFASFCRVYTLRFPDALKFFNNVRSMKFPQKRNLPRGSADKEVVLKSTNPVLEAIPGCDGLKTGYINESGFNLAFTIKKGHSRLIAVIMGGSGRTTREGNAVRVKNAKNITDWFYANFETFPTRQDRFFKVQIWGGKENCINLVETLNSAITIPRLTQNTAENVKETVEIQKNLVAPISAGQKCGRIVYSLDNKILQEIPLIADRDVEQADFFKFSVDMVAQKFFSKL